MGLNEFAMRRQYFVHASWAPRFVLVFPEVAQANACRRCRRVAASPMRIPNSRVYVCLVIGQVDTWDGQVQLVIVEAKPECH
jgi:hypothetical protein